MRVIFTCGGTGGHINPAIACLLYTSTVESEAAKLGMHKPNSKQSIELNLSGQDKAEIMTTEKENILQTAWKAITGTAKKMIEYFR